MVVDFYYTLASPPCRSVYMLAKALHIPLNLKSINTMEKEQLKPEFIKLNPQHTVPTIDDNGFALSESRAILAYFADKYGKKDSLYPKDPKKRAVVDQRLYFDMGTFFQRFGEYFMPIMRLKQPADPEKLKKLEEALEFLDGFLAKTKYAAGDDITIADYALVSSFSTILVAGVDCTRFSNVTRWYELCRKNLPGIEINEEGVEVMKQYLQKMSEHPNH